MYFSRPLPALVAPAVHWLVDSDCHGSAGPAQADAVGVEAVGQGDLVEEGNKLSVFLGVKSEFL